MNKARVGKTVRTICFLCEGATSTNAQSEAAISDYKANHPDWDTEDLIKIRVNGQGQHR